MKTLVFDVDDVLLDWRKGFFDWMDQRGYKPLVAHNETATFNMGDCFSLEYDTIREMAYDFNQTTHFENIPAMDGAPEGMAEIHKIATKHGFGVACLTSPGDFAITHEMRRKQLDRDFKITNVQFASKSKKEFLIPMNAGLLVDDLLEHVVSANELGIHSIIMDVCHNRHHDHSLRANDWPHLIQLIEEDIIPQLQE